MKGAGESTKTGSPAEFRRLIVHLGIAMVAAGDAVDVIEESLRRIVAAYGVAGLQVALLPTSLFVQTGADDRAHVQFSSQVAPPLRLAARGGLAGVADRSVTSLPPAWDGPVNRPAGGPARNPPASPGAPLTEGSAPTPPLPPGRPARSSPSAGQPARAGSRYGAAARKTPPRTGR